MSQIDEIFEKKKGDEPILDLSKTVINTEEEYEAVLEKVPDFKIKPEKVRPEDVKIRDKLVDQKTKTPKKEIRAFEKLGTRGYDEKLYTFMNPIPAEMGELKFEEICAVSIEWRMLTSQRPKLKIDEDYFDRLIELGKAEIKTKARDKREASKINMIKKTKNRAGVTETRVMTCAECGEEYCNGKMCGIRNLETFTRIKVEVEAKDEKEKQAAPAPVEKPPRVKKKRRKPRKKSTKSESD